MSLKDRNIWLLAPAVLLIGICFLYPVSWLLQRSVSEPVWGLQKLFHYFFQNHLSGGAVEHCSDRRGDNVLLRPDRVSGRLFNGPFNTLDSQGADLFGPDPVLDIDSGAQFCLAGHFARRRDH